MTKVIYNGITLKDVLTHSIEIDTEYDSAGVDPIYQIVRVNVETLINLADADLGISGISSNLVTTASRVIEQLSQPRRRFRMVIGDRKLFDIAPIKTEPSVVVARGALHEDVNNGPRTKVQIREIISESTMRITFTVTCHVQLCGSSHKPTITNLRWHTSDSIDESWHTTRTISGRLRVRSRDFSVHELRRFVIPPLQGGFKRHTIELIEDPSGLALDFRIVDVQEYAAPPFPATKWHGSFTASQPFLGDLTSTLECRVHVEGPPDVSRADLIAVAARVLMSRLLLTKDFKGKDTQTVPESLVFTEQLHKNAVDAVGRVRAVSKKPILAKIAAEQMGRPLPPEVALDGKYDPLQFPVPLSITGGLRGIFLAALQTPCDPDSDGLSNNKSTPQASPYKTGRGKGDRRARIKAMQGRIPYDKETDKEDTQHKDYPYLECRMTSKLETARGKLGLPVGEKGEDDSGDFTQKIVEMALGLTNRIITIELERYEKPPEGPVLKTFFNDANGIKHTLIKDEVEADAPKLAADGRKIYYLRMKMVYALSREPDLEKDKVPMGRLPYIGEEHGDKTIEFKFKEGIIE